MSDPYVGHISLFKGAVGDECRPTTTCGTPSPPPTSACTASSPCAGRSRCRSTRSRPATSSPPPSSRARRRATRWRRRGTPVTFPPIPVPAPLRFADAPSSAEGPAGRRRRSCSAPRCTSCGTKTPPSSCAATTRRTRRCSRAPARSTCRSRSSGSSAKFEGRRQRRSEDVRKLPYRETITAAANGVEAQAQEAVSGRTRPVRECASSTSAPAEGAAPGFGKFGRPRSSAVAIGQVSTSTASQWAWLAA